MSESYDKLGFKNNTNEQRLISGHLYILLSHFQQPCLPYEEGFLSYEASNIIISF